MYILFAAIALIGSIGNTIFNRISSEKIGEITSATIKSFMITIACFFICVAFGHFNEIFMINAKQFALIFLLGLVTVIDWLFYFLALKRSHLEAFAPFEASAILFFSNLFFSIFMTESATKGGSFRNILLVSGGLIFIFASMIYAVFNKKINPKKKLFWVLFSLISSCAVSGTLVFATKIESTGIYSDVIAFYQMLFVFIVFTIMLLISKEKYVFKEIRPQTYFNLSIAAIFNAIMIVFRYIALAFKNSNQSVVNIVVGLDFVFVSIATVLFFKANNKKQLTILILLVITGMILNALPELL